MGLTYSHGRSRSGAEDHSEPPRPPPPRPEGNLLKTKQKYAVFITESVYVFTCFTDYYSTTRQFYEDALPQRSKHLK